MIWRIGFALSSSQFEPEPALAACNDPMLAPSRDRDLATKVKSAPILAVGGEYAPT